MKKKLFIIVALALFWSCNGPSEKTSIQNGFESEAIMDINNFVSLDRAYIPPLFLTSVENLEASQASFEELKKEWTRFQNVSTEIFNDPEWVTKQQLINEHILAAEAIISEGENIKDAHEELEHVREILLEVRQRNEIDYFVDYLTAFHEPMEQIVLTAKLTPIDQWTEETTSKIQSVLPKAEALWEHVQKAEFNPVQYGFNEKRFKKMKQYLEAETNAFAKLKLSLENEVTIEELRQNALGIKPNFAGLFKLFGNVEAYQKEKQENSAELM